MTRKTTTGKVALIGVGLTLAAGALGWLAAGPTAGQAAGAFGLLATGIHLTAAAILRIGLERSLKQLAGGYVSGMALRLVGVGILFAAVSWNRELFPPIWSMAGYLVVLIPLLFMEILFLK